MEDPRFALTEFVIEATDFECHSLWREHNYRPDNDDKMSWTGDGSGTMITVGRLNDMPVNISIQWAMVNGMLMMFYWACSQVVDYKMVESWLKENCNPMHGNRRAHTDAQNFHVAIHASNEKKEAACQT